MFSVRWVPWLLLPLLVGCSDLRATFEINGTAHSLSVIRVTRMPWEKTAEYAIVASRMPDCTRRHAMSKAALNARVEVYSPGNDAWILRQDGKMYVVETRTCEGFSKLNAEPENGLGVLMGSFEMRDGALVFRRDPKAVPYGPSVSPPISN